MDIPVGITHGYVAGAFNEIVRDSGDAGSVPDAVPLEGTVEARWLGREISGDTPRLDKTRHLVESGAMFVVQDYVGDTALAVTAGQLPATALVSGWWQMTYTLAGVDLWRYEVRVGTESEGTPLNIALAPADAPPAVIAASAALVEALKADVENQLATFGNRLGGVEDTASVAGSQATNAAASATASAQAAGQAQTAAQNAETSASNAQTALTDATQAIANKTRTWRQSTPPAAEAVGDQWYHIGENNKLRIWDGSAWVAALPGPGAIGFADPTNAFPNPGLLPELWRPPTGTFYSASDANVPTGCPQPYLMRTNYRTNYLPPINATEGDVIYFSVWVSPDMTTPDKTVAARIKAIDKDNQLVAWLSTEAEPAEAYTTQAGGTGWRRIFGRFKMPANTAQAVPYILVDQYTPYETHWFMSGMTVTREDGHLVDETMIGTANGVASLDSSAKVPVVQMPQIEQDKVSGLSGALESIKQRSDVVYIQSDNLCPNPEYRADGWLTPKPYLAASEPEVPPGAPALRVAKLEGRHMNIIPGDYPVIAGERWYFSAWVAASPALVAKNNEVAMLHMLLDVDGSYHSWRDAVGSRVLSSTLTGWTKIEGVMDVTVSGFVRPTVHVSQSQPYEALYVSLPMMRRVEDAVQVHAAAGRGAADGVASLDAAAKVPVAQIPALSDLAAVHSGDLAVSDRVSVTASGTLNAGLSVTAPGTTVDRLSVNGAGQMHWSDGTAEPDTKLYRNGSGQLRTDGEMLTNEVSAAKSGQRRSYVGATSSGPPTTGTYDAGDFATSLDGGLHVCTAGGTPGTWVTK